MTPQTGHGPYDARRHDCWKSQKLAQLAVPEYERPGEFWGKSATVDTFYSKCRDKRQELAGARITSMQVPPGSRVLDIGAGPGTLAVPLALQGCEVTAVEPSEAMREALARYQDETGAEGITVVPARWEDVLLEDLETPYDVVIASYSLAMVDIREAVGKMQRACSGTVHLFWFLTLPRWAQVAKDLWPALHGAEFRAEPTADCLWQELLGMGILADIAPDPNTEGGSYASFAEVMEAYRARLSCSTPEHDAVLRGYLESHLVPTDHGYRLGGTTYGAHIWWNTSE
jgi:SAM-dependent methyltransferase